MAQIPAICRTCGLLFPSILPASPGSIFINNVVSCPRCLNSAPILNGYTTIINGMVAFIVSTEHSHSSKLQLIDTATSIAKGEVKLQYAASKLDVESKEGGRLLREWATLGLTFLGTIATVAGFILTYIDHKGNADPLETACEKFDETLASTIQPDQRRPLGPSHSIRPALRPLDFKPNIEKAHGDTASAKPPNENRKARRARIKKDRSKVRK